MNAVAAYVAPSPDARRARVGSLFAAARVPDRALAGQRILWSVNFSRALYANVLLLIFVTRPSG